MKMKSIKKKYKSVKKSPRIRKCVLAYLIFPVDGALVQQRFKVISRRFSTVGSFTW